MEFADYPGLNGELAADFQARHFMRRDTHVGFDSLSSFPPYNAAALAGLAVDVKPRLTKEQHDVLENEFQKQSKPNTNTKKRFAEVLGVSLDKVNNWFQNRRAKSKQDAKKQAGAFNLLQASHSQQTNFPSINAINSMSAEDISPTYCPQDSFNDLRDSAVLDGPLSNGLGISAQPHIVAPNFSMPMGLTMQKQRSQHQHPVNQEPEERGRRTLTQAQFDAFGQASPYGTTNQDQAMSGMSATINNPSDLYGQYDFPDLCDFNFGTGEEGPLAAEPMQPSHSADSWHSNALSTSDHANSSNTTLRQPRNPSARSDSSTPSVSITPANQEESDPFALVNHASRSMSLSQPASWQPGTSIPVDLATLQQEFQEAAMRHRTQSVPAVPHHPFLDQPPVAFPIEGQFPSDASTTQLARSMQNFSMQAQRSAMPSSTIAARRQRPKPAPIGTANVRSTSFGGRGANSSPTRLPSGGQSLRRVKSSQTMNGISGGRIQKNISSTQRSPSAATFAGPHRLARRVSSFSPGFAGIPPLPIASAGLAPPTPLSPTSYANMQAGQGSNSGDSDSDNMNHVLSTSSFSPPTTPVYAPQYPRGRLGSAVVGDNTPPQSAPAMQQSFSNTGFSSTSSQVQSPMTSIPMLQSQSHGFVSMMPNDYSQMSSGVFPGQQQSMGGQFMDMPMSYIMTSNGEVHMGYQVIPPFAQHMHQQGTPPNTQHQFLSSSNSSPVTIMSSQVSKHHQPAADFFVHEYTPPQDVKQMPAASPRKATDGAPKNYTFSNHGPEYFERNAKKLAEGASPDSSAEEEITG